MGFREPAVIVVTGEIVERVRFDRGATIVAAVGVSFGDQKMPSSVDFGDRTVILRDDWIAGINYARSIGVGHIELIGGGDESGTTSIAHEGDGLAVKRAIHGELGFGAKAGDQEIGGNRKRVEKLAAGGDVIEEDRRGDTETAVDSVVVKNSGIGSVGAGRTAANRDRHKATGDERNRDVARNAVRRQRLADSNRRGVTGIDAATEYQTVGYEVEVVIISVR